MSRDLGPHPAKNRCDFALSRFLQFFLNSVEQNFSKCGKNIYRTKNNKRKAEKCISNVKRCKASPGTFCSSRDTTQKKKKLDLFYTSVDGCYG